MNEEVKAAQAAIEREDYQLAGKLLQAPARSGSAEAQYLLGYLYFTSADVDLGASRQWLKLAAAQQHPEALFYLSTLKEDGSTGVPATSDSCALLIKAAELGSLQAQRDLGCYYAIGEGGFLLNAELGRMWYKRAAERGHADAQYNYGLMVILGEGGYANEAEGLEWIRRAAEQQDIAALHYLSQIT